MEPFFPVFLQMKTNASGQSGILSTKVN